MKIHIHPKLFLFCIITLVGIGFIMQRLYSSMTVCVLLGFTILLLITMARYFVQIKEKRKAEQEFVLANTELAFQLLEKENRAQEFVIANRELAFQNQEKEDRATELSFAKIGRAHV